MGRGRDPDGRVVGSADRPEPSVSKHYGRAARGDGLRPDRGAPVLASSGPQAQASWASITREVPFVPINAGDTAFVLVSAALVALMTPGLAFFYGGLVRRKNFLAIMMQSFISMGVVTTIWVL